MEGDKCLGISWAVRPGQLIKLQLLIAEMKLYLVGQPSAVWR